MTSSTEHTPQAFHSSVAKLASDCYIVSLGGEIDLHVANELRRAFDTVAGMEAPWLVVDLSDATFIDSCLLALLAREHKRLGGESGGLVVVADDVRTLRPLEISGLDRVVHVTPTLVEAIMSLGVDLQADGR